jgi:hypothetical protein
MVYGHDPANWTGAAPSPGVVQLTTITGTDGDDTFHVLRAGTQLHVYVNIPPVGEPTHAIELAAIGPSLTINALAGDDALIVNSGTQALGVGRLIFNAGSGSNSLVLEQGGARIDSTATGGALNSTVQAAQLTTNRLNQNGLTISGDGSLTILPGGQTNLLTTLDVSATGTLDLADNDLVIQSTAAAKPALLSAVYGRLAAGYAGGLWNGAGIVSSNAAANTNVDTTLALVDNAILSLVQFGGLVVDENSLLLKYTYYGDIDLNGQVDADDLTVFANNFGRPAGATQIDGDIDFDGDVDADDLTVFANNFGRGIGAPLAAAAAPKGEGRSTKDESVAAAPAGRPGLASAATLGTTAGLSSSAAASGATGRLPASAVSDDLLLDLLAETITADVLATSSSSLADARLAALRRASAADALWADENS